MMDDPFIQHHDADELNIAGEFLTNWLPFLTRDLCDRCSETLTDRIRSLRSAASEASDCAEQGTDPDLKTSSVSSDALEPSNCVDSDPNLKSIDSDATVEQNEARERDADPNSTSGPPTSGARPLKDVTFSSLSSIMLINHSFVDLVDESPCGTKHIDQSSSLGSDPNLNFPASDQLEESPRWSEHIEPSGWGTDPERDEEPNPNSPKVRMSWADMAQEEDELAEEEERTRENEEVREGDKKKKKVELSREQREWIRFKNVRRKKDFICLERVNGKIVNILDGLELHTGVFSAAEQKRIIDFVYELQEKGRRSEFGERTYSEPQKWMRGKGRVTIQFGCCYNYAMDRDGNPPGILQNVAPDPIPSLFKVIIKRLVSWHVLPTSCIPDSCIVNIYEPGDCIPPHIDSHDFVRPFSTVSFLSECNMLFGSNLKIEGPGEFSGSTAIPLPVGSVLVLNGNGADVAKHCVPAVPAKRISITFRKMDASKHPTGFNTEPDLQNIRPLPDNSIATEHHHHQGNNSNNQMQRRGNKYNRARPVASQYQSHDADTTPIMRPRQIIDARSAATNPDNPMGRVRDVGRRPFDSEPRSHDVRRLRREDGDEPIRRSPQQYDEGSGSRSDFSGSGRRVRLDQERIVISRNLEGDEDISRRNFEQAQHSRGPLPTPYTGRRRVRVVVADD